MRNSNIEFNELIHTASQNFQELVVDQSSGNKTLIVSCGGDRIETTIYWRGSKILGKLIVNRTGRKYYIRKE
jgi:hypothetical protein